MDESTVLYKLTQNEKLQTKKNININTLIIASMVVVIGIIAEKSESVFFLGTALLLSTVYACFCNKNYLLIFTLLLIAPNRILTIGPISAPTLVMAVGAVRAAISGKIRLRRTFIISSILLMFVSIFTYTNGNPQVLPSVKIIVVLFFIYSYTETEDMRMTYATLVDACATGCVISFLFTLLLNPASLYGGLRFSMTGGGGENVLGILCAVMILNLLCIILYGKKKKRIKNIAYIVILGVAALMTGSRSALLALLIGIIGIVVVAFCRLHIKQVSLILFFAICAALVVWFSMQSDNVISGYIDDFIYRAQKLARTDISNGRYELWAAYYDVFRTTPAILWLGGMNISDFGIDFVAHNMIMEQIAAHGIIGSIIIFVMYANVYYGIMLSSRTRIKLFSVKSIPLVTLILISMVSHTLLGVPQTMMLFLSAFGIMEVRK